MPITVSIPGQGDLVVTHVLCDLNGTLARDGLIAPSTRERLVALRANLVLHVMSADTHGTLDSVIDGLPIQARRTTQALSADEKRAFLLSLGADNTIAIGNGRNDVAMLAAAVLGMAILGPEGCAREALLASDVVFASIDDALDALLNPLRLVATLRG